MEADYQMARSHGEGWSNLAVGEPFFLRRHLTLVSAGLYANPQPEDLQYPHDLGLPELIDELKARHAPGTHIVVTTGAKQAISAAIYALKKKFLHDQERKGFVMEPGDAMVLRHEAPYWPSYPTMAALGGLDFASRLVADSNSLLRQWSINVTTSPNNPDGRVEFDKDTRFDIWDAAYAHPVYGWDFREPKHRISVWSAAKLLGLSGLRVGWLATREPEVALNAARYVEFSTSGVNTAAQRVVAVALREQRHHGETGFGYTAARSHLLTNGAAFLEKVAPYCEVVKGMPIDGRGMFAWFKARDPNRFATALHATKTLLVTGEACGVSKYDGWYRMSMGHEVEFTERALSKLKEALDGQA